MQKGFDIVRIVNGIGEEVELVLKSHNEEKYFEEIMLLNSLIENLLKWSAFVKILWERGKEIKLHKSVEEKRLQQMLDEVEKLGSFYKRLDFYSALNIGLSINLIGFNLYKRIDKVRIERNNVTHQLWIYGNRRNSLVLRKTLERLAGVARQLARITDQLTDEIGVEEVYKMSLA